MGLLACVSVCGIFIYFTYKRTNFIKILSQYTFPIYLMHTIFAAGFRIVLMKLGIMNPYIHFTLGFIISFIGPSIAAYIMLKIKYFDFVLYPTKYIYKS